MTSRMPRYASADEVVARLGHCARFARGEAGPWRVNGGRVLLAAVSPVQLEGARVPVSMSLLTPQVSAQRSLIPVSLWLSRALPVTAWSPARLLIPAGVL